MSLITYVVRRTPKTAASLIRASGKLNNVTAVEKYVKDNCAIVTIDVGFESIAEVSIVLQEIFKEPVRLLTAQHENSGTPKPNSFSSNWRYLQTA